MKSKKQIPKTGDRSSQLLGTKQNPGIDPVPRVHVRLGGQGGSGAFWSGRHRPPEEGTLPSWALNHSSSYDLQNPSLQIHLFAKNSFVNTNSVPADVPWSLKDSHKATNNLISQQAHSHLRWGKATFHRCVSALTLHKQSFLKPVFVSCFWFFMCVFCLVFFCFMFCGFPLVIFLLKRAPGVLLERGLVLGRSGALPPI